MSPDVALGIHFAALILVVVAGIVGIGRMVREWRSTGHLPPRNKR